MKDQKENKCVRSEHKPNCSTQEMAGQDHSSILKNSGNLEIKMNTNSQVICSLHENGHMYCNDCENIVCGRCETVHINHDMIKLGDASLLYKAKLNSALVKVRNLIRYAIIVKQDLHSYNEKLALNMAEITQEVLQRAVNLPAQTELLPEMLISDVETEHNAESNRINTKITEFDTFISNAKLVAVKCEHLVNASDDNYLIRKGNGVLSNVGNMETSLPLCPSERFIYILSAAPPTREGETLPPEEILGFFRKESVPWRIEVRRTGSFKPETMSSSRFVTTMCSAGEENVWVVWQWGPLVHLIDKEGNVKKTVDAGAKVDDICIDAHGNLVISCHEARCVKMLDSNNEVCKTIQLEKMPRGVKLTSKNQMVLCCVQNLHYRNGDHSIIAKVNCDSSEVGELSSNDCLVQPWRIAVNVNGDICVSDRNKGAVIIFGSDGKVKATYSGPEGTTRHPFAPHAISCDNYGQILVVDYSNHTVHVLDPLGRFRGFLIMDTELEKCAIFMGTSSPFSMAIDSVGDVWVGNKFGYLTVLKYLS